MPKRRRSEAAGSIMDFLQSTHPPRPQGSQEQGLAAELYSFLSSRGVASKKDVIEWGASKGLRAGEVYRLLDGLVKDGKVIRRLDDNGELVYLTK